MSPDLTFEALVSNRVDRFPFQRAGIPTDHTGSDFQVLGQTSLSISINGPEVDPFSQISLSSPLAQGPEVDPLS